MWFAPPPHLPTKIVTALPERYRRPEPNEWSDINRAGHAVDAAFEGPCFDAHGRLYIVDIPYGRIFRIDGTEWELITQYDGWPNGMKVLPDGNLIVADYRNGIVRVDPANGKVTPHLRTLLTEGFKGPNDLTLHPDGSILFTDQGTTGLHDPSGRVWRIHPDGRLDCLLHNGPSPNGLVLNKANTHLYVAMSRSAQVWRFMLRNDAAVTKAPVLHTNARRNQRAGWPRGGSVRPLIYLRSRAWLRLGSQFYRGALLSHRVLRRSHNDQLRLCARRSHAVHYGFGDF